MRILIFILFFVSSVSAYAQPPWCWAEDALAAGNEEFLDVATDPVTGVSYAVGFFSGDISLEFPFGVNNTPDMSTTLGTQDGLVAKYDASGNTIWAFKIGNLGDNVWITGVEIGAGGNIFITGYFNDNCNFQGVTGSGSSNLAAIGDDAFVASYDANGILLWARKGQSLGEDRGMDIAVNSTNVYITGWFQNTVTFDNGGAPTLANDDRDAFVVCYDQVTGTVQWESFAGDIDAGFSVNDRAYAIAADDNEVYVTGIHTRTIQFDGGPMQVIAQSPGNRNIYLAEYDAVLGTVNWVGQISPTAGSGSAEAHGLAVDANNFYVVGGMDGNVSVPGGGPIIAVPGTAEEIFACAIARPTKITQWVEVADNNNNNPVIAEDVVTDGIGNVYITGPIRGVTQFNGGLDPIVSGGSTDCFVMCMKDAGTYMWTTTGTDNSDVLGQGVGCDNLGGVYVAGRVLNQATFGALPALGDAGGDDGFIAKINCTAPCSLSIICPPNQIVTGNAVCQYTLLDYTALATPFASCGIASVKQIPIAGTVVNTGVNPIWVYLTDLNGNEDSCTFDVIVEANVNPVIVNCGDAFIGETTIGQGDNGGPFSCTGTATPGEDVYYQITVPTGNYQLSVTMSNVVDGNDADANTFWVGGICPIGSGCISADNFNITDQDFDSNGLNQLIFNAIGPGTYYFVVDSETDGIDAYDISFDCVASGIEFDETNCGLDVNNDGLHVTVDGSTTLNVNPCQTATFCHTIYTQNILGGEWMDTVVFDLGPCYTNITNIVPTAPGPNGLYDLGGTWTGVYDGPTNSIEWGFQNSVVPTWGDGLGGIGYACRPFTFCFDAVVSATCLSNNNLDIQIQIEDDGVNGAIPGFAPGFDYVTSNGFAVINPPPTITCPANVSVGNDAGVCTAVVNGIGTSAAGDNCPGPIISYTLSGATTGSGNNDASGSTFNLGVTTVQYTITDSTGGTANCSFTVTVNDTEVPTITCPANVNVNNDLGVCTAIVNGIPPVAFGDNCAVDSVDYVLTGATTGTGLNDASGLTFNVGVTTVRYNVTDQTGNSNTCIFTVTVVDNENPVGTCPGNIVVNTNPAVCTAVVNGIPPGGSENCSIDSINYVLSGATVGSGLNNASGLTFNLGVTTVNYFAVDLAGNTANCSFTVTVNDNQSPTISCVGNVSVPNAPGVCTAVVNGIAPTGFGDNCGVDSVSYTLTGATVLGNGLNDASGLTFNTGITTVSYLVTDNAGNTQTCSFTVTVTDAVNPTITCPANVNTNNDVGVCSAVVNGIAPVAFGDNCGIDSVSYTLSGATVLGNGLNDASGLAFNFGVTTVTYTITDLAGNTATCNFSVTVNDNENPTITCPLNTVVSNDPGVCSAVVNGIAPVSGDNCSVANVNYTLAGATVAVGINDASGLTFNDGVTTVTYTVTDPNGNSATCNFTVTVNDAEIPTLTCPGNINVNNDLGTCTAVIGGAALLAANDNCGIDSISYVLSGATIGNGLNNPNGDTLNLGVTTVTYTVTDLAGNTATCNFNVTVSDNENPDITCPANVNVSNAAGVCNAIVNGIAPLVVGDNCGIDSISYVLSGATILGNGLNDASGNTFNVGITTVTYTVTDNAGNTASCNFNVTVSDTENPTITCAGNVSTSSDPGVCTAVVGGLAPTLFNDNCGIDSVSYVLTGATIGSGLNDASGATFNSGITTVTYTVTDQSGNTSICNVTVTVTDAINPTITCPVNINVNNDGGICGATVNGLTPITADNCAIDSVSYVLTGATTGSGLTDASGNTFNLGITTVTYTVTDLAGNTATCFFTVTVVDAEVPTITCPGNAGVGNDIGLCSAIVNGLAPTATGDNCGIDSVSYVLTGATTGSGLTDASGNTFNLGITTITYTVTDSAGNTASCNSFVTVLDTEVPTITCPGNVNANNDPGTCTAVVNGLIPLNPNDNCGIDSISYTLTGGTIGSGLNDASGNIFNLGVTTVIYTIRDNTGNFSTCNFTVTVIDTEVPTITCPLDVSVNNDPGVCSAVVNGIAPVGFSDNCTVDTVTYLLTGATVGSGFNDASGLIFNGGITTITYIVADVSGNLDSCSFTITVNDIDRPSISCVPDVVVNNDPGTCSALVNGIAPVSVTDNCTIDSVGFILMGATIGSGIGNPSGEVFNYGITTVSYYVYDMSGNVDSCSFTVTVNDTENPNITCPTNITSCDSNITVPLPIVSDNCGIASIVNDFNLTNDASGIYPIGITNVTWTIIDSSGNSNTCIMSIEVEMQPIADAGTDQTLFGITTTNFDATPPTIGSGSWLNISGFGNVQSFTDPLSFVNDLEPGDNVFEWVVSNGTCPDATDEVIITVVPLNIPNGFSPNGDGNNDLFVIKGLNLLENEIAIFNRWGVELYTQKNYQNDWDGRSSSGKDLPEDTYFYIIKIPGLNEEVSGFIVLKR